MIADCTGSTRGTPRVGGYLQCAVNVVTLSLVEIDRLSNDSRLHCAQ